MIKSRKKSAVLLILCILAAAAPARADYCFTEEIFKPGAEGLRRTADDTVTAYYTSYQGKTMDPVLHSTMRYTITHKDLKKRGANSTVYDIEGTDYVIESDNGYRVLDRDGSVVIDKGIYNVMIPCNGRIAVQKDGKYGIITPTGEIVKPIEQEIGTLSSFYNGRAIAWNRIYDQTVLVDENLDVVLDNSYILNYIDDGLYSARNADLKCALMDSSGKLLTDFRYTYIRPASENGGILAAIDGNTGVLKADHTEYADLEQYGYTVAGDNLILSEPEEPKESLYTTKKKYALADADGKLLTDWCDALNEVGNSVFSYGKDDNFMLIDASGSKITEIVYSGIGKNSERIFGWYTDADGKPCTDVYDSNGVKINQTAGSIRGLAMGSTRCSALGQKYALTDENGNLLTDFIFSNVLDGFKDMTGNPAYKTYDGAWRYYDCTGREMDNKSIENIVYRKRSDFDYMTVLSLGTYYLDNQGALYNNETKQFVITYDQDIRLQPIDYNKTIIYKNDSRYGVMDKEGNILFQLEDAIINLHGSDLGFYNCTYEDGAHMLDFTGRDVFGRGYDEIIKLNDGVYVVKDGLDYKILRSDTVDTAYHTDKRAYINGAEIPCFEVDAFTAVTAEDLGGYGFDVRWNGEEKRLDITRNPEYYEICPVTIPEKGEKYTPYKDIKYSDIQVYYEGEKIKSYAADGQMLIDIEDIAGDGVSVKNTSSAAYVEVSGLEHR